MILAFWRLLRPVIMLSVMLVYALGALIARWQGLADWRAAAFGLVPLLLVSISIHYVNEYADVETDSRTQRTPYSGGSGVLPTGAVSRRSVLIAAWIALLGGLISVLMLIGARILPAVVFPLLVIGTFFGWMYSVPPLKLAWRGFGELDNALLGGLLLPLYGYVCAAGQLDWPVAMWMFPFTLATFLNLLATTWADRRADGQAGKCTLAVQWPVTQLRALYAAVAAVAIGALAGLPGRPAAFSALVLLPMLAYAWTRYTRTDAPHASVWTMVALLAAQMIGYGLPP